MKTGTKSARVALLLASLLTVSACFAGIYGVVTQRQKRVTALRESAGRVEQLAEALSVLHDGRAAYLSALSKIQSGENAYETQKDLVRIAQGAVEKRRQELARSEAGGTLTGAALDEARSELRQLSAEFAAQQKAVADFEALKAKVASYEKEKTRARALLQTLREDAHIREKLDAGAGPVAAARAALAEEAAALRRRFVIALSVFAALGISALVVLCRALGDRFKARDRRDKAK